MSDISLPPQPPQAPRKLLDNPALRTLLLIAALAAPVPMLISVINFWQEHADAAANAQDTPFALIRQIVEGSGDPPLWLVPVALIPSFLLLMVLGRTMAQRVLALILLLAFAAGGAVLFLQLGDVR